MARDKKRRLAKEITGVVVINRCTLIVHTTIIILLCYYIDVYGIGRRRCARERVHNNNVNLQHDNKFYGTTTAVSLLVFLVDNTRDSCSRAAVFYGGAWRGHANFGLTRPWRCSGTANPLENVERTSVSRHYSFRLYRIIFQLLNIMKNIYLNPNIKNIFQCRRRSERLKTTDWREVEVHAAAVPFEYYY